MGLVLLLVEVVSNRTQNATVQNHGIKEVVEFLGKLSRHRDRVLRAQFPNWIAVTHTVYLSQVVGYLMTLVLSTAESEKERGRPIFPHHAENITAT